MADVGERVVIPDGLWDDGFDVVPVGTVGVVVGHVEDRVVVSFDKEGGYETAEAPERACRKVKTWTNRRR